MKKLMVVCLAMLLLVISAVTAFAEHGSGAGGITPNGDGQDQHGFILW